LISRERANPQQADPKRANPKRANQRANQKIGPPYRPHPTTKSNSAIYSV
jgi:hypothetical protein